MAGKPWNQNEILLLEKLTNEGSLSFKQIVPLFTERTANSLQLKSRERNFDSNYQYSKWDYNRDFFKDPNPINCFYAGWLAADGSISFRNHGYENIYDLRWECHVKDKSMVNLFANELGYNGNIKVFQRDTSNNKHKKNSGIHCIIRLNNISQMAEHLKNHFGLGPKKTHHLPPPNLNNLYLKLCYLIGYINGDGCVHLSKQNLTIKFYSSSLNILNWVKELTDELNLPQVRKKNRSIKPIGSTQCFDYSIIGTSAIYLYCLLKSISVPILSRKWDRPEIDSFINEEIKKIPNGLIRPLKNI